MVWPDMLLRVVPAQASGIYLSRSLSYEGAEFSIINVDIDPVFKVWTTNLRLPDTVPL